MILIILYIISVIISFLLTRYCIRKNDYSYDFISIVCPFIPIGNIGWAVGILITLLFDI